MRPGSSSTVLAVAAALLAAGCGRNGSAPGKPAPSKTTTTATTASQPARKDAAGCTQLAQPAPKGAQHVAEPTTLLGPGRWTVVLQTNCGRITILLDPVRAPRTASSFASLVRRGFYDGLTFHRVVPGFVVQGGDPLGNGQGGAGYKLVEKPPPSTTYRRRVVAMAKAQVDAPGASESQFFIVTAQDAGLPPIYALVGRVVGSMKAVDRIAAEPTNAESRPLSAVVIEKATLERR